MPTNVLETQGTLVLLVGLSPTDASPAALRAAGVEPKFVSSASEAIRLLNEEPDCLRMITAPNVPDIPRDRWIPILEEHFSDRQILVRGSVREDPGLFPIIPRSTELAPFLEYLGRTHAW